MNPLTELVQLVERDVVEAERKIKQLKEINAPETLNGEVAALVQRHNAVKEELQKWEVAFFTAVVELSKKMKLPDMDTEGFIWRSDYPSQIRQRGFIAFDGHHGTIEQHVDHFNNSRHAVGGLPIAFWDAMFERLITALRSHPSYYANAIKKLKKLAQKIEELSRKKK